MKKVLWVGILVLLNEFICFSQKQVLSFESLLQEMVNRESNAKWPEREFKGLQISSYNRESISPNKPGWFADSDGIGYIREEKNSEKKEYVIMEHIGPGCITRMWTPFFYYDFNNRKGPIIRVYLDGRKSPVIEENFIAFLSGKGSVAPPFARFTARAGVCFLPLPFGESCKITLDEKPFYNIINYRAYSHNTEMETFTKEKYKESKVLVEKIARKLTNPERGSYIWEKQFTQTIRATDSLKLELPSGSHSINYLKLRINSKEGIKALRSTILKLYFDNQLTVWCPVGDFYCSVDTLNSFTTRSRKVSSDGKMECFWIMPYSQSSQMVLINLLDGDIQIDAELGVNNWLWDNRSMYFHAGWKDFGPLPGNKFFDLNFVDIQGCGLIVGDALTVLSPGTGWWGEGDEKIYIDNTDVNRKFPSHFGTGTEDYYGWAGGVVPDVKDVFSAPFGANVRIGNRANPRGYNICTRERILDDIPFENRLVFNMEASPGTDIRNPWNLLAYSSVVFWYGMPGAKSNNKSIPLKAKKGIMTLSELDFMQDLLKENLVQFNPEILKQKTKDPVIQDEK